LIDPTIGGFETNSMQGWTQVGGTWELTNEGPFAGSWCTLRTTGNPVYFYRDLDLTTYSYWIDAGMGINWYSYWQNNDGNSEWTRTVVRFYNASGAQIGAYDSDWISFTKDRYSYVSRQNTIPVGARSARIEIHAKRTDGDNTDVRFDNISFKVRFVRPFGTWTELLGPFYNNGGFESGSMEGWTQVGGNWDVDTGNPHSGVYSTDDNAGSVVYFYRDFALGTYSTQVDAGRGFARYGYWARNYDNEFVRLIVRFYDSGGTQLGAYDSDWMHYTSHQYAQIRTLSAIPVGTRSVRIEVHALRTEGDLTDVQFDDVSLEVQFGQ